MNHRLLGALDIPILLLVAAAAIGAWMVGPGEQGARATAFVDGKAVGWWPLSGPLRRDTIAGNLGPVVIEHGLGGVVIVQAPCPNHICLKQGKASHQHDQLICVPSHLVVAIGGDAQESRFDAVH